MCGALVKNLVFHNGGDQGFKSLSLQHIYMPEGLNKVGYLYIKLG